MVPDSHAQEIEQAFERGRAVGRVEGLAFDGVKRVIPWTLGAQFRFKTSWFQSYLDYERNVLKELRRVQWATCDALMSLRDCETRLRIARDAACRAQQATRDLWWAQRLRFRWSRPWDDDLAQAEAIHAEHRDRQGWLECLQQQLVRELAKVRAAVDAELEEGRGRACIVEAMRQAPNRPRLVREYRGVDEFVREDPRRALHGWPDRHDASGMDFGFRWRLEDLVQRWKTTRWRVSWLDDSTHEVYAIEVADEGLDELPGVGPLVGGGDARTTGRVWLLGVLANEAEVRRVIGELELHAQRERNSLVVVAQTVSTTSKAGAVRSARGATAA